MNPRTHIKANWEHYRVRIPHWRSVLEKTRIPAFLIIPVAEVLAHDELAGPDARTPRQKAIMARAAQSSHVR